MHISPLTEPVEGSATWIGADLASRDDWQYHLTDEQVTELEAAAQTARSRDVPMSDLTSGDFPLPTVSAALLEIAVELENGRGFVQMRGLPVHRYSEAEATLIYWGIALHLGIPVPQNHTGDLVAHVRDMGGVRGEKVGGNAAGRGYNSSRTLPYHTDASDVVGLLCLRTARSGGTSTISSAAAVHNELLRTRPDLLELLYQVWPHDSFGEEWPGEPPFHYTSIFAYYDGKLSTRWMPAIKSVQEKYPEIGDIPAALEEALELGNDLADKFRLDIDFKPGDIQLLNNYAIMHSRTEFEDDPSPELRRHMLRVWLTVHNGRALAANFGRNPGVRDEFGGRGGLHTSRRPRTQ
jgi:hypothetical protein